VIVTTVKQLFAKRAGNPRLMRDESSLLFSAKGVLSFLPLQTLQIWLIAIFSKPHQGEKNG